SEGTGAGGFLPAAQQPCDRQFFVALVTASETVLTNCTMRGPQRLAMSSSSSKTASSRTALTVSQPDRSATVSALWSQHLVSERKIRSGSAATICSWLNCGEPPAASGSSPSAMLSNPNSS